MARDAGKKRSTGATRSPQQRSAGHSGWRWFFSGLITGVILSVLAYLSLFAPGQTQKEKPAKPVAKTPAVDSSKTQFDFYTLLPEREVVVPASEQPTQSQASTSTVRYVLQAGSFRRNEDADRLRAKLLLMGLDASVEAVTSSGSTWHRVLVGPFDSRSLMSKARATLIHEGIDTLLLKHTVEEQ